ncbi:MAG TPA: citrate synthase [Lapillicoccus sp.]|uniref:citrate synthase n=1 Tax=Lapillicoccus sp. TaxID=1909287 RepID=UPI002F92D0DC
MSTATAATPSTPPEALVAPPGLAGVIVATTALSDVRGQEGFYHYRQYDAVDLARTCSIEEVWHLLLQGHLPDEAELAAFRATIADAQRLPAEVSESLAGVAAATPPGISPMTQLRTALSMLGGALDLTPVWDLSAEEREHDAIRVAAQVPVITAAAYRRSQGLDPLDPRPDLGYTANHLWMITGTEPAPEHVRAVERYLCLTVDHGFNASTFTARVVASTGADVAACVVAALGALSGPLHGGAPSRALDSLDAIGTPENARPWADAQLAAGHRIMGFGHAIYRGKDPRSQLLRETAEELGGPLAELAVAAESAIDAALDAARPDRTLRANVEFYAGVVMHGCGIPREMFTPTFAVSRAMGWTAHVLEQARERKIIRPSARYAGPPPPQPVPPLASR